MGAKLSPLDKIEIAESVRVKEDRLVVSIGIFYLLFLYDLKELGESLQ